MLTFGTYSISGGALLINQQGTIHLGLTLTGCSSTFELWNHWLVPAKYLYNVPTTAIHYLPNNYISIYCIIYLIFLPLNWFIIISLKKHAILWVCPVFRPTQSWELPNFPPRELSMWRPRQVEVAESARRAVASNKRTLNAMEKHHFS